MKITKAAPTDLAALTCLACKLWPGHTESDMSAELQAIVSRPDAAFFLAWEEAPVGFAQCQLRRDYVEGTASSPVGYLEGIYVTPPLRRQGIAKALLAACEDWARQHGCTEFASDCELQNEESLRFHLALGFQEANRIICFTRSL